MYMYFISFNTETSEVVEFFSQARQIQDITK